LFKRLNHDCSPQIVGANLKGIARMSKKVSLPRIVVPHVHKCESKYVREVIEEASAKTWTIFPIDENYIFGQFNEVSGIKIPISKNLIFELEPNTNNLLRTLRLFV
jgi:hypothetical protein